jgi:methylmalonyl-CoA mutase cobalamin-binding subunit
LTEYGVDTQDPLQVLLGIRRLGASELERSCHPGPRSDDGGIVPLVPTEISQRAKSLVDRELQEISRRGHSQLARGRRFLVASADTHSYALDVLVRTLRQLGADVIEAGVDVDPEQLGAAASALHWPEIAVSTHNGQCVGYVERLMRLLPAGIRVYVGGRLNHLEDGAEPVDATERLRSLGAMPCVTVADILASG